MVNTGVFQRWRAEARVESGAEVARARRARWMEFPDESDKMMRHERLIVLVGDAS